MKKISKHQLIMLVLQAEIELEAFQDFEQEVYDTNGMVYCIDCVHVQPLAKEGEDEDDCPYGWTGEPRCYTWYIPQQFRWLMPNIGDRLIVNNLEATASVEAVSEVYKITKKAHLESGHPHQKVVSYDFNQYSDGNELALKF